MRIPSVGRNNKYMTSCVIPPGIPVPEEQFIEDLGFDQAFFLGFDPFAVTVIILTIRIDRGDKGQMSSSWRPYHA